MSFVKFLAISCLLICGWANPLKGPFASRQVDPPTASTVCGDIIVAVNNGYTLFRASLVYECLQSVPLNPAVAMRFIDYYNMTLQFQSTLGYVKAPPTGYQRAPFDIEEALQEIKQNVTKAGYRNQYEFEAQIQLLVNQIRDTHVVLNSGILSAFSFVGSYGLASASIDGKQAPDIYLDEDLRKAWETGEHKASPVTHINGVDVIEYLETFAEQNSEGFLEPHADWNAIMNNPALDIQGIPSTFQSANLYPGDGIFSDALNFTLQNDTVVKTVWWAICVDCEDTGPLTTGGDFYNYFVLGNLPESYVEGGQWWPTMKDESQPPSNDSDSSFNFTAVLEAYCTEGASSNQNWCMDSHGAYPNNPMTTQADLSIVGGGIVSSYMLDDNSTAVLSIPSFFQDGQDISSFRQAVHDFVGNASQRQASRVIIDLQQNSGGLVLLAYDTFKQFFPSFEPNGASRQRSHELSNILGEAYTEWWNRSGHNQPENSHLAANEWIVTNRINAATGEDFASWSEFYGPEASNGDRFSGSQRYNLSDQSFDYAAFGNYPYGYNPDEPITDTLPPWAPEDIVILTDGLCASACAIFVEFMTYQAGVKTIVVGGQPKPGPMQAVSGSRGAASYSSDALDEDFEAGLKYLSVDKPEVALQLPDRTDSGIRIDYAGFTIRNQVRGTELTPLQFQYQAANCRIYYTLETIYNSTKLWSYTARAAWDDPTLCVQNSTGYPTARNETSVKLPPSAASVAPATYDFSPLPFAENITFELLDSTMIEKRRAGQIRVCTQNDACSCHPLVLQCPGGPKTVQACLPKCKVTSHNPGGDCPGTGDFCSTSGVSSMKIYEQSTYGGTNYREWDGYCKTTRLDLCPR
ncbi:hypothetical protein AA0111_g4700 [Alternaria arborescens]|uniref:hypothetical protein n=1 Tax=Alternaria arborescens TaxID=156630 RepID=UPI001075663F|nr:hypothetical protein AA0111_g4700 [Alternaria arborescens]RYO31759.1 hypothetical protein AA0111_g4700 [Alternaria arborescens]